MIMLFQLLSAAVQGYFYCPIVTREGRSAAIWQSFGLRHSWNNQTVPFGFLILI